MVDSLANDASILKRNIDKLEQTLSCADENGLFKNSGKDDCDQIVSTLVEAFKDLETFNRQDDKTKDPNVLTQAWEKYRKAHHQLNQAINSATFSWRFKYLFGGPFIIYLLLLLAIAFSAYFFLSRRIYFASAWGTSLRLHMGFYWGNSSGLMVSVATYKRPMV